MPVPPSSDIIGPGIMFEQIKAEPIGFYSNYPPPNMAQTLPPRPESHQSQQSVITSNEDNKELQQQSISGVSSFFR